MSPTGLNVDEMLEAGSAHGRNALQRSAAQHSRLHTPYIAFMHTPTTANNQHHSITGVCSANCSQQSPYLMHLCGQI